MSTKIEITARLFASLSNIEDAVSVAEFIHRELTGDETADKLLIILMLVLLEMLHSQGMITADSDLRAPSAKVYGLTQDGKKMYQLFQSLTAASTPT